MEGLSGDSAIDSDEHKVPLRLADIFYSSIDILYFDLRHFSKNLVAVSVNVKILRLNKAGIPVSWLTREEAATLLVKEQVMWSFGKVVAELYGGYNNAGIQSVLRLPSIVACEGQVHNAKYNAPLDNRFLFRRDRNICLYCGKTFHSRDLSRDHVTPVSRGGLNAWTNVVSSCRRCNNRKADRTPEEAGMELLAVPFAPNQYEFLYLSNHNVLADQMDFLSARFSHQLKE